MSTIVRPAAWTRMKQAVTSTGSELSVALRACRGAFLGVALMSGVLNVLYLTGSFFMLEIYDRVLPLISGEVKPSGIVLYYEPNPSPSPNLFVTFAWHFVTGAHLVDYGDQILR